MHIHIQLNIVIGVFGKPKYKSPCKNRNLPPLFTNNNVTLTCAKKIEPRLQL